MMHGHTNLKFILLLLSVTYLQFQTIKNFVICSFHSIVYEDYGLMGYMLLVICYQHFEGAYCLHFQCSQRRIINQHTITTQRTVILIKHFT